MATDLSAVSTAVDNEPVFTGGLNSPPESYTNPPKHDASDSELSDLDDTDDTGEIVPDHWADDGHVPVFKPTYHQFKDFIAFVSTHSNALKIHG